MSRRSWFALLLLTLVLAAAPSCSTPSPAWGYAGSAGPEHWSELSPEFVLASTGQQQSPIDIATATVRPGGSPVTVSYADMPLAVLNTGNTVEVKASPGNVLHVGQESFALQQFHFHSPSEHTVDGQHAALEVHLVHKDAQGHAAVVSVLVEEGASNAFLARIWPHLPPAKSAVTTVAGASIDLDELLPKSLASYQYPGSLTTPPCSEGLAWFVLRSPVQASPEQVRGFREVFSGNNRPTQPLNGREVRAGP